MSCGIVGAHQHQRHWTQLRRSFAREVMAVNDAAGHSLAALEAIVDAQSASTATRRPNAPERYELRLSVSDPRLRQFLTPETARPSSMPRIVGASFQVGDVDGHGDSVVLLIERPAEEKDA